MSNSEELINIVRKIYHAETQIALHEPYFDEDEKTLLSEVIESTFVSSVGLMVGKFEDILSQYTGSKNVIATSNGTSALHTGLIIAGVQPDDEVLTQSLSFVATSNSILYTGASPIFIDSDRDSLSMSPEILNEFLSTFTEIREDGYSWNTETNKRVSACIIMHTFGIPGRIEEISSICKARNITLIEDAAESLGSLYMGKHTGIHADIGILSFNGNKIITTGGGGCLLIQNDKLANKARHITTTSKIDKKWFFEHDQVGYNYRMPNLNAALGIAQMKKIDFFITIKRKIAGAYQKNFENLNIDFIKEMPKTKSNYWLNAILVQDMTERDKILLETNKAGIMTRPAWTPMHYLPMNVNYQKSTMENTEWLFERIINLPSSVKEDLDI